MKQLTLSILVSCLFCVNSAVICNAVEKASPSPTEEDLDSIDYSLDCYVVTQPFMPSKMPAVVKLRSLLDSNGVKVDEIRLLDTASVTEVIVRAHIIPMEVKNEIFELISLNPVSQNERIKDFIANSCNFQSLDEDNHFKEEILRSVSIGCEKSERFRELFVLFMIKQLACKAGTDEEIKKFDDLKNIKPFTFIEDNESHTADNIFAVHINLYNKRKRYSFFKSDYSEKKHFSGMFEIDYGDFDIMYTLYHEIGHIVSHWFTLLDGSVSDLTLFLCSKIIDSKVNPKLVKANIDPRYFSKDFQMKHLFTNGSEFFQIIGICLFEYDSQRILAVNSYSDFVLATELGWPIRADHDEICYTFFLLNLFDRPVFHSMNSDFYEAMFEIYGYTMKSYKKRLKGYVEESRCSVQ